MRIGRFIGWIIAVVTFIGVAILILLGVFTGFAAHDGSEPVTKPDKTFAIENRVVFEWAGETHEASGVIRCEVTGETVTKFENMLGARGKWLYDCDGSKTVVAELSDGVQLGFYFGANWDTYFYYFGVNLDQDNTYEEKSSLVWFDVQENPREPVEIYSESGVTFWERPGINFGILSSRRDSDKLAIEHPSYPGVRPLDGGILVTNISTVLVENSATPTVVDPKFAEITGGIIGSIVRGER